MRADSWFFATTPIPRPAVPGRRPSLSAAWRRWWHNAGEALAAAGENARHHRMGSWEAILHGIAPYNGNSVK